MCNVYKNSFQLINHVKFNLIRYQVKTWHTNNFKANNYCWKALTNNINNLTISSPYIQVCKEMSLFSVICKLAIIIIMKRLNYTNKIYLLFMESVSHFKNMCYICNAMSWLQINKLIVNNKIIKVLVLWYFTAYPTITTRQLALESGLYLNNYF